MCRSRGRGSGIGRERESEAEFHTGHGDLHIAQSHNPEIILKQNQE